MTVPVPTKEELELVRDYVLMPHMLDIIASNSTKIRYSNLGELERVFYLKCNDKLMDEIMAELDQVRQKLSAARITVHEIDQDASDGAGQVSRFGNVYGEWSFPGGGHFYTNLCLSNEVIRASLLHLAPS